MCYIMIEHAVGGVVWLAEKVVGRKQKTMTSTIRWTVEEHAFLTGRKKAWGVSIAAIIRTSIRMALGIPTVEEANIRRFQEIERQLAGLSINFNQLTRAANAGKVMWTQGDTDLVSDLAITVKETRGLFREYQKLARQRGFDRSKVMAEK